MRRLLAAPDFNKGHLDVVVGALHLDHLEVTDRRRIQKLSFKVIFLGLGILLLEVPDRGVLQIPPLHAPLVGMSLFLLLKQPVAKSHQVGVARRHLPQPFHLQAMLLLSYVLSKLF